MAWSEGFRRDSMNESAVFWHRKRRFERSILYRETEKPDRRG